MNSKKYKIVVLLLITLAGCKTKFDDPKYSQGEADFSRFVTIGGSYTAGFADNALYLEAQQNSFPAILASRFALAGGGSFNQPLVNAGNGLGKKYILNFGTTCTGTNGYYVTDADTDISNYNWIGNQGPYNNLGVPGARCFDLNSQAFGKNSGSIYYNRFTTNTGSGGTGLSSTILADAGKITDGKGLGPTFFSLWIGLNDVIDYALAGGESSSITSLPIFNNSIDTILTALGSYSGNGVVANIPDINSLPFFTTLPYNGLILTQNEADTLNAPPDTFNFVAGANLVWVKTPLPEDKTKLIKPGELVLYSALDFIKCKDINNRWGTPLHPIPSKYILDLNEISNINNAVNNYNSKLQTAAATHSLAFVDMNSFFHSLQSGIIFNGVNYQSQYLTGGMFSLDGIHPNSRGYALIANEFIRVINTKYKSTIPEVDANNYPGIRFP